jgi:hypothetical protein
MSAIFSDPPFRRGSTLCGGDLKDTGTGNDLPGTDIVGSIKAFQDIDPSTGVRYSNRLVYCTPVRWGGADTTGLDIRSKVLVVAQTLENGKPFATVSGVAADSNAAKGQLVGVVDEYLKDATAVKQGDVIWLVVKGPTTAYASAGVGSGEGVQIGSAGAVLTRTSGELIGSHISPTATTGAGNIRVNLLGRFGL